MQLRTITHQPHFQRIILGGLFAAASLTSQMSSAAEAPSSPALKILGNLVSRLGVLTPDRTIDCDTAGQVQEGKKVAFACTERLAGTTTANHFTVTFEPAIYRGFRTTIKFSAPGAAPSDEQLKTFLKITQDQIRITYNTSGEFSKPDTFNYSVGDSSSQELNWRQATVGYAADPGNYGLLFSVSSGKEPDGKSKTIAIYFGILG